MLAFKKTYHEIKDGRIFYISVYREKETGSMRKNDFTQ